MQYSQIAPYLSQGKTPAEIAVIFNETFWRDLPSKEVLAWLGEYGRMAKLQDASVNQTLSMDLRGACLSTLILVNRTDTSLNLSPASKHREMLLGCVQAGVFQLDPVLELIERTRTQPDVTEGDIVSIIEIETRRLKFFNAIQTVQALHASGADDAAIAAAFGEAMD